MSSKNSTPESLADFFQTGKVDADFEVQETYVTGICTLYPDRLAGCQEYTVREKAIVERSGKPLSVCAQEAKDLAFQSAVQRMAGTLLGPRPTEAPVTKAPGKKKPVPEPETPPPPQDSQNSENAPAPEEMAQVSQQPAMEPPPQTALAPASQPCHLKFDDLRPASSLVATTPEPEADSEEQRMEKARSMEISILGKLHECSGWTAGRLLDERPEIIVDLVKRYNGPKAEEKEALRTLYNEALRRIAQAA